MKGLIKQSTDIREIWQWKELSSTLQMGKLYERFLKAYFVLIHFNWFHLDHERLVDELAKNDKYQHANISTRLEYFLTDIREGNLIMKEKKILFKKKLEFKEKFVILRKSIDI